MAFRHLCTLVDLTCLVIIHSLQVNELHSCTVLLGGGYQRRSTFRFSPGNCFATCLSTLFSAGVLFTPQSSSKLLTLQNVFSRYVFFFYCWGNATDVEMTCHSSVQTRVSLDFCCQAMICNYGTANSRGEKNLIKKQLTQHNSQSFKLNFNMLCTRWAVGSRT